MSCCSNGELSSVSKGRDVINEIDERKRYNDAYLNDFGNSDSENKNKNFKNEGKIIIYFYGENLIDTLINQTSIQESNIMYNEKSYKKNYNNALNWEYYIFEKITEYNNKIISNLIQEHFENSDFYDIIVITVDNLLDEKSKLFFSYFEKFTNQKAKQPFILFLTKKDENPKVEILYKYITNEYFDKRTLYALKYPSINNENETNKILELICKFRNYYHEEGDSFESFNEELSTQYKFNILVCGRAGSGKSSFINKFLGEKKAKEGEGLSVTHKIVSYCHRKYPINISDTPGFEDIKTVNNVKNLLERYNKKLLDGRKKINLIIYLFPYGERSVLSMELPLLESLLRYNTEIIFVINFVTESIEKSHYKRIKQICEDSLRKIFPEDFNIRIYPINLYSQIDDDDSDNIKVIKAFGMDKLFKDIYSIFKSDITSIKEIMKIKSIENLFNFFEKNKLFNHFKQINDIFISFRSELSNLILSYGRQSRLSFQKDKYMENMANLIFMKCIGKKCENYQNYLLQLSSKEEVEKLFDKFTQNLEILKSYNQDIHTMFFYKSIHDHKTLALGYLCMHELEKLFESSPNIFLEKDKLKLDLIKNLCDSYNQAINAFNIIANNFENYYMQENEDNNNIAKNVKSKKNKYNTKKDNVLKEDLIEINDKFKED